MAVSAGIGGASLLYSVGKGIADNSKANAIEKNNVRPTYHIPDEYKQNVEISKQMAQIGLPTQQYNNQRNAINQGQASGIASLNNSANPGANIAAVVRAGDNANNQLNAQDATARQNNQRFAIGQNAQLGQQELAKQQYNDFDKYTEQFNRAQAYRGASNANIQNGINGASQLAGGLYGMGQLGYGQPTMGELHGNPVLSASSGGVPSATAQFSQPPGLNNPDQYNFGANWNQPINYKGYGQW